MSSSITTERKMELAAGVMKIILAIYVVKSILLLKAMLEESTQKGVLVGLGLLLSATLLFFLGRWCITRPARARWVLCVPICIWGIELSNLLQLFSFSNAIGILICVNWVLMLIVLSLVWNNPDFRINKWLKGHPWRSGLLRFGAFAFLLLGIAEMGLRAFDFKPGVMYRQVFFHEVSELKVRHDYATDENGIFAWSPEAVSFLNGKISSNPKVMDDAAVDAASFFNDYELYQDYVDFHRGKVDNPYWEMLKEIEGKADAERTEVEQAYHYQAYHPLNQDGFRSIAFRPISSPRKSILLIGDSFTWGHSADNFTSGFADRLAASGYVVYNAGISGTDPAQYEAIAQKYIPILQPDVVVVNFFMGNDIVHFRRPLEPYKDLFYHTNAGNLMAYPGPERLSTAEAAYSFVGNEMRLPVTGLFSRVCSWSVVTTLAWRVMVRWGILSHVRPNKAYWDRCAAKTSERPVSNSHLKAIRQLCNAHQTNFILAVIPEVHALERQIPADFPGLFDGLQLAIPRMTSDDYTQRDEHFNDKGHIKYTQFLKRELEKVFSDR